MQFARLSCVALLAVLTPAAAWAAEDEAYDFVPNLRLNVRPDMKSAPCDDVPSCAIVAAQDPAYFSDTLEYKLRRISAPLLVEGLAWTHSRPAVTERARIVVERLLFYRHGHTRESAQTLLRYGLHQDAEQQGNWLRVLSGDPVGRAVVGEYIDAHSSSEDALMAMKEFLLAAPTAEGGIPGIESDVKSPYSPTDRARIQSYANVIWRRYLAARPTVVARREAHGEALLNDPELKELLFIVLHGGVFQQRLADLIGAETTHGDIPIWEEVKSLTSSARQSASFRRTFRQWSSSKNRVLRLLAPVRGQRRDKQGTADEASDDLAQAVLKMNPPPDETEALQLAILAGTTQNNQSRVALLNVLGERYAELRKPLRRQITSGPIQEAREALDQLPRMKSPGLQRDLMGWILSLQPQQLKTEEEQNRLATVSLWLDRGLGELFTQRGRGKETGGGGKWGAWCGTGREQYAAAKRSRQDMEAFGMVTPEKAEPAESSQLPEPDAQEVAVRAQEELLVLQAIQDYFRGRSPQ